MAVLEERKTCPDHETPAGPAPDIITSLLHLGVYGVVLLIVQRVASLPDFTKIISSPWGQGTAVIAAASLGFLGWHYRRGLYRTLTSLPFAVAILLVIIVATGCGTFIIQSAGFDELKGAYGPALAKIIFVLGLNDLFHSFWFGGFLILLAVALIMVAAKKRMWRPTRWGQLIAHLGIVIVIAGGLIGFFFGQKGMLDLHEGKSSGVVRSMKPGPETFTLPGFAVGLEKFSIEKYTSDYRLTLYQKSGADFAPVGAYNLDAAKDWIKPADASYDFRVAKVYPDFQLRTELKESAEPGAHPALALMIKSGDTLAEINLFDGLTGRDRIDMGKAGVAIRFQWNAPTPEQLEAWTAAAPARHAVSIQDDPNAPATELTVSPGGSYDVAGKYRLRVLDYVADFVYDTELHKAVSRSPEPNNPALQVALDGPGDVKGEPRWLFAKMPDFNMGHGGAAATGPRLVYSFSPGRQAPARELLVVGEARQWWELADGKPVKQNPLGAPEAGIPEMGVSSYELHASAIELNTNSTKSEKWNNPVIELELRQNGNTRSMLLPASHSEPLALPDHKTYLGFAPSSDEVKAYRSQLAIVADGKTVAEKTIAVNNPLKYQGWAFYQSNFRKEDPTYSGLLVVHDPGLTLVWAGFIMMCAGVLYAFYVRPRLLAAGRTENVG